MDPLSFAARHGPWVLIGGLVAGLALPPDYNGLRNYIREMVVALLFLSVLRVGPTALLGSLRDTPRVLGTVLVLQLAVPLCVVAVGLLCGLGQTPLLLALTLATCAPAITGSPNIAVMLGVVPTRSLQVLIVSTVLLPLSILPVFWLSQQLGSVAEVLRASRILIVTLSATLLFALLARHWVLRNPTGAQIQRLDGASAIVLALFVIGLMPEFRETAIQSPAHAAQWLAAAVVVNWGAQAIVYSFEKRRGRGDSAINTAIYAGNRNIALFLVALPADITQKIMVFVGCYQVPLYLTPMFLRWYAQSRQGSGDDPPK